VGQESIELAKRAFDAFAERDVEALLELVHEEVEFLPVTASFTTGGLPYRGHEGIRQYFLDLGDAWEILRVTPREFRDLGSTVLVLGRVYATRGGRVIDSPTGWVWEISDGKIVKAEIFADPRDALKAVGLAE
jgi:ketosteroid isomerase-like protein